MMAVGEEINLPSLLIFCKRTNISDVMADAAIFRTNFSDPKMESLKKSRKVFYSSFASTMISFAVYFTLIKIKEKLTLIYDH